MLAFLLIIIIAIFAILMIITNLISNSLVDGFLIGLFFNILIIAKSITIVKQNTVQLVEFLGKFNRILRPGLNFVIPFLEKTRTQVLYKTNRQISVDGLTKDNVTTRIELNVIYYVKNNNDDIFLSIYEIDNPDTLIKATVDEQLRSMVTEFTHKEIFTKREEIGHTIELNLREKLKQFGYTLDSIQVQDIILERSVLNALNKIVETEKLREAAINEAEAKKIKLVKEAEADKESKKLIGEGMAEQRKAIAEGFKESVQKIKESDPSLNGEKVLQFLLDSSRIETLEKLGSDSNTKVIYLNENLEGKSRVEKLLSK